MKNKAILAAAALSLRAGAVLAQTGPGDSPAAWNPDNGALPTDPRGILAWIIGGGGAWVVAEILLSEVLSRWAWFEETLSSEGKRGVAFALSLALSMLATWALSWPLDFWLEIGQVWPALLLAAGAMGIGINQGTHHLRKGARGGGDD